MVTTLNKSKITKSILVLTVAPFPYGSAMSSRIRSFCNLFRCIGYKVHVIALVTVNVNYHKKVNEIDGYTFEIILERPPKSRDSFIINREFISRVKSYLSSQNGTILFSDGNQCYYSSILKIAKVYSLDLYIEQCEKYNKFSFKFGYLDLRFHRYSRLYRYGYLEANGIIVISRFLEEYFKSHHAKTLRIPTILDVDNIPYKICTSNHRIRLIYSGISKGRKEILAPIIKLISADNYISEHFEICIYGTSKSQLIKSEPELLSILHHQSDNINFYGFIPQENIFDVLANADYQIFIRPIRDSSSAGFPTKLGESMAVGTPVITNITGDIRLYLNNRVNGFILCDTNEETVKNILEEIIHLSVNERTNMRINARTTAEKYFNYRNYTKQIGLLFNNSQNEKQK